ncbi:MAG: S9 family peptidase [Spirochaetales bacterium]|nr:S9 family peptidase [Spirochaetales bacterium]
MKKIIKYFPVIFILLNICLTAIAHDTLKSLTAEDYARWQNLGAYSVSDNGMWVSWSVTLVDGDDTLYIKNVSTSKLYKYPLSTRNIFSDDSRWAACRVGYSEKQLEKMTEQKKPVKYKTRLVNLESEEERIFENIESFIFTKGGNHLVMSGYAGEDKTKDIFIHNLRTGYTKNIGNISEFAVNKQGDRLAYAISAENKKGNGVEMMDLNNYNISFFSNDTADYKNLVWDKEGNVLMFFKAYKDTSRVEDNHTVFAIRNIYSKPEIRSFDPSSDTIRFPKGMYIKDSFKPIISDDYQMIYFGAFDWTIKEKKDKKSDVKPKIPGVDIWHWKDDPIQPRQKTTYNTEKNFTYLFAWNPVINTLTKITDDTLRRATITGDGSYVIVTDDTPYKPLFRETIYDYYLVNPSTGVREPVLSNFSSFLGSSPSGKYLYYFKEKNWWVYDISRGSHLNMTKDIETPLWNTRDDRPVEVKPPFGNGGWLKEDRALFVYDEYDVWKISMDGSKPLRLTDGRENKIIYRVNKLDNEYPYHNEKEDMYFSATGDLTKESGYYRLTVKNKFEKLIYEPRYVTGLNKAEKSDYFVYRSETFSESPNIYRVSGLFRDPLRISDTNPQQAGFAWGKSELVNFTNRNGRPLQGALFYPANYIQGKKYPMIVYIYEIRSNYLNRYVVPSPRVAYNTTNFTSQDYFVYQPDIVYKTNHPGESAVDCVIPAVEEIIKTGMIDEKKIGIMGHSWGAYQTSFIITQTDIFAAAVAGAPLINMISMYNEIYWNTGNPNQNIFEISQGRLREPWWVNMEEYMANSPMFQAKNIKTPLLVAFGTSDGAVDWHQGIEMFTTMRRMEKPYIMLVYDGENHSLAKKENQLDYARKVNEFFNHYLLGEKPGEWILKGRKYIDRKIEEEKAAEKK